MRIDTIIDEKDFQLQSTHYTVFETTAGRFIVNHSRYGRMNLNKDEYQAFIQENPPHEANPTPLMFTPINK